MFCALRECRVIAETFSVFTIDNVLCLFLIISLTNHPLRCSCFRFRNRASPSGDHHQGSFQLARRRLSALRVPLPVRTDSGPFSGHLLLNAIFESNILRKLKLFCLTIGKLLRIRNRVHRLKESIGWNLAWLSPHLDMTIEHVALNAKVMNPGQDSCVRMLAVSYGCTVQLWQINDNGQSTKEVGTYFVSYIANCTILYFF